MRRHLFAIFLSSLLLITSLCPAFAAEPKVFSRSGMFTEQKLSREEITDLLRNAPDTTGETPVYSSAPSVKAPYLTGEVTIEAQQIALNRLNAMRRLAGLSPAALDPSLSESAQYGAVICEANNSLDHDPAQPQDMPADFFEKAFAGASRSNLSACGDLAFAVDRFMSDDSGTNTEHLGHRRWQLNPGLGRAGFGIAGRTVTEYITDRSGEAGDYDFVSWPASGNFPNNSHAFRDASAWSVTLNPDKFATPEPGRVVVTLTRASDGKQWVFSGNALTDTAGKFFTVNTHSYAIPNCIIFHPDGIGKYEGVFEVQIEGLEMRDGTPAILKYSTDFFDPDNVATEEAAVETAGELTTEEVPNSVWVCGAMPGETDAAGKDDVVWSFAGK